MNSQESILEINQFKHKHWLRRLLQTPLTFMFLVWAGLFTIVVLCFEILDY